MLVRRQQQFLYSVVTEIDAFDLFVMAKKTPPKCRCNTVLPALISVNSGSESPPLISTAPSNPQMDYR